MAQGQFRFAYMTPRYDATVAFYRDQMAFPIVESWSRSPDDRGTLFGAASGLIEVQALPQGASSDHLFDARPAQGAFMVIEVEDVDSRYRHIREAGVAIQQALNDRAWGHRSFCVREPNGLTLYFFSELEGRATPRRE